MRHGPKVTGRVPSRGRLGETGARRPASRVEDDAERARPRSRRGRGSAGVQLQHGEVHGATIAAILRQMAGKFCKVEVGL